MSANRIEKINMQLQKAVSDIINNRLKDPRLSGIITVTGVNTSRDFKHADIHISIFNPQTEIKQVIEALNASSGFIRSTLFKSLNMRSIPNLHFYGDDSMEYSQKISRILEEINNDNK